MSKIPSEETKTLLEWALRLCPDSSRNQVKTWIAKGRFCLNGEVVNKASVRLPDPGDTLTMGPPSQTQRSWGIRVPIHPKLVLVSLDSDLAIVDKEAGLLSVPTNQQNQDSALDALAAYLNDARGEATRRGIFGHSEFVQPLPVHRLDQYTSGLLCIAMNEKARAHLIDQLRRHDFLREYIAYVDGEVKAPTGTWRNFMQLDPTGFYQNIVPAHTPGATEAITHYKLITHFAQHRVSKLRLRLETGLKHQIRLQAAAHGLTLIGDRRYEGGTKKALAEKGGTLPYHFKRQALHAATIGITHPTTGRKMRFESKIPGDMQRLEARISDQKT
ncbi:MAG: RluA family pseudouridine synthase [Opitutales bacterium]|nr:RluA family pseudouridine synthase [Opitutales bacterium]